MPEIDHSGSIYTMEISKYSTLGAPALLQSESQLLPLTRKNNTALKLQASWLTLVGFIYQYFTNPIKKVQRKEENVC